MNPLADFGRTARLTLRTWKVADAEALGNAVAASRDHLSSWMPWAMEPLSLDDRRDLIAQWDTDRRAGGDVVFGIFADGTVVGGCGLHRRAGPNTLEIGYWTHVDFGRRGYATEASGALTDLAFTVDGIERVEIHHDRANVASGAIPRRLGFEFVGETPAALTSPGEEGIDCCWATTRDQWDAPPRV